MIHRTTDVRPPYSKRLTTLREALQYADLNALLVTHPPNLRYLVGFDGSQGALLVTAAATTLFVDGRYITSARDRLASTGGLAVGVELADRSLEDAVVRVVSDLPELSSLGVEAATITLSRFHRLRDALGKVDSRAIRPRLQPTEGVVEQGRIVKDDVEVAVLRQAAARLSSVARQAVSTVSVGRTEQEIAAELDHSLRRAGFERPAFETIVATGPNSALPHARPGPRVIQPGDGVVLDFGGIYDGYCVDLTRTVQLAPATDEFGRLFEAVRAAHSAAIRAVRPGILASEVDRVARRELENRALGDAFVHGTGHGLGLELHEEPRLTKAGSGQVDHVLQPGMVFTIEPGAYVPGLGGVRIEDDVLVVATGCEVLTDVPIVRTRGPGASEARGGGRREPDGFR